MPRTTVSTSGSSGKDVDQSFFDLDGKLLEFHVGVAVVLAGDATEFPAVIGADQHAVGVVAGSEGSIAMRANSVESVQGAFVVADHVGIDAHDDFGAGPGG